MNDGSLRKTDHAREIFQNHIMPCALKYALRLLSPWVGYGKPPKTHFHHDWLQDDSGWHQSLYADTQSLKYLRLQHGVDESTETLDVLFEKGFQ